MTYRVVEHYLTDEGLPHWPGNGTPFGVIGGHSTESVEGEQALWDVLAWMVATAGQRGASYHELLAWTPAKPDDCLVVRCVEPGWAAGSVGIGSSYRPDSWVLDSLGRSGNANDPNQGIYALAIVGRSRVIRDEWARDPRFVRFVHRRLLEIREEAKAWQRHPLDRLAEHFRFNPTTRTDWGRLPANLTLAQRQAASPEERDRWHAALTDALGGLVLRDELPALPDTAAEDDMNLAELKHQIPKIVRIKPGSTLFTSSGGVHWVVPADGAFDAELFGELDGRWVGRRATSDGAFLFDDSAIDHSVPFRLATYGDPVALAELRDQVSMLSAKITAARAALG